MRDGTPYARCDGSVKDGFGVHAYGFMYNKKESVIWGGAALTTGSKDEMPTLRIEYGEEGGYIGFY